MTFVTKKINSKIICILDIGTYKIRAAICKFKNHEFHLVGYGEKRQNSDDIIIQDFVNIEWICENIQLAIQKAEYDCNQWWKEKIQIKDIVINVPFEEIFLEASKINHVRENPETPINTDEIYQIMEEVEYISLKHHYKNIKEHSWYHKKDLRLIIPGVTEILLDKKQSSIILNASPKEINISVFNIFIPEIKYELIQSIARALEKNILQIIPSEFAITRLFPDKKNIVIIDLWSAHTSIIIKKDNHILWINKIPVWIDSLIKQIKQNHKKTDIEIIASIDTDLYHLEKKEFLQIFKEVLTVSLEEILWEMICPSDFFMIWWGGNKFIKTFLENTDFNTQSLKIAKNISFVTPKIDYLENIDSSKSNLNIYAMMKATLDFITKAKDPVEEALKEVIKHMK